jgi:hypothetical protein
LIRVAQCLLVPSLMQIGQEMLMIDDRLVDSLSSWDQTS